VHGGDLVAFVSKLMSTIKQIKNFHDRLGHSERFVVRYEDLTNNPYETLSGISEFLNITFEDNYFRFADIKHHLIGGNQGLLIQHDSSKIDELSSLIGYQTPSSIVSYYTKLQGISEDVRWKSELTKEENDFILKMVNENDHLFPFKI
jgi:hypothetical protein